MQPDGNADIMKITVSVVMFVMQFAMWGVFIYYLTISMFGWIRRKELPAAGYPAKHKFVVIVAAHNEEKVIGGAIRSLNMMSYPREMYDIFVIADNCTDNTAKVAMENGARVFERFDSVKRGKGYSLEWMFKKLFEMDTRYDAICILDADNLVSQNFLLEMNKHLCMGHKVVQGYLDSKNPNDSWVSGNNSIAFWISNRLIQLPRYYLGLSCVLGGTGFIVSTDIIRDIGWGATCLAEDLEFTLKLVLKGMKVYWAHDAVIYDEKPLRMPESLRQRKRWMQGHFDCARRFFWPLVKKAATEKDIKAFDAAMYLLQPLVVFVNGIGISLGAVRFVISFIKAITGFRLSFIDPKYYLDFSKLINFESIAIVLFMFAFMYLSVVFVLIEGKLNRRIARYIMLLPLYNLTWIPIIARGFIERNNREWFHTVHTKAIDITEIETLEKV